MIGLHHMSYSPAAQAQQQHLNELRLADAKQQRRTSSGRQANAEKVAHHQHHQSHHNHREDSRQLISLTAYDQTRQPGQQKFIKILPKTADQIMSSVPKCKSGKSRQNPSNFGTLCGSQQRSFINYQQEPSSSSASTSKVPDDHNQVLLIVQDDHHEAGGFPVIGRRLPDKSAGWSGGRHPVEATTAPVVGRRSRRQQHLVAGQANQASPELAATTRHFQVQLSETPKKSKVIKQTTSRARQTFASSSSCSSLHCQSSCSSSSLSAASSSWPLSSSVSSSMATSTTATTTDLPVEQAYCMDTCCVNLASECQMACCQPRRGRKGPPMKSKSMRNLQSIQAGCVALVDRPQATGMVSVEQLSGQLGKKLAFTSSYERSLSSSMSSPSTSCQANCPNAPGQLLPPLNHHNHLQQQHQHLPAHQHQQQQPPPIPVKPTKYTLLANQLPISLVASRDQQQQQQQQLQHRRLASDHNLSARSSAIQQVGSCQRRQHYYHANRRDEQRQQQHQQDDLKANQVTQMYESLASELKAKLSDPKAAPILLPPKDYDTLSRRQGKLTGIELRRSTNPQLVGPANTLGRCSFKLHEEEDHQEHTWPQAAPTWTQDVDQEQRRSQEETSNNKQESQRSRSNSSSGLGSISLAGSSSPNETINSGASRSPSSSSSSCSHGDGSGSCEAIDSRAVVEQHLSRGKGIENHNPSKVSDGILWNGRVEIPLKVNQSQKNGNTYLATKQIIY